MTAEAKTPELKPCPFCRAAGEELGLCYETGQTPQEGRDWFVRCYVCHVETARQDTMGEAVAHWNRRVGGERCPTCRGTGLALGGTCWACSASTPPQAASTDLRRAVWQLLDDQEMTPTVDEFEEPCYLVPVASFERVATAFRAEPQSPALDVEVDLEGLDIMSVRDWLRALPGLDMDDVAADGGVTVAMVVQQEAREMAARLDRALAEVRVLRGEP
jgi:hypothetical protein